MWTSGIPPLAAGTLIGLKRVGGELHQMFGRKTIISLVDEGEMMLHDKGKLPLILAGVKTGREVSALDHLGESMLGFWCESPEDYVVSRNSSYGISMTTEALALLVRTADLLKEWVGGWRDDFVSYTTTPEGWDWLLCVEQIPDMEDELFQCWIDASYLVMCPYMTERTIPTRPQFVVT